MAVSGVVEKPTPQQILLAVSWTVGALLSFSAMAIGGRELSDTMHPLQITLWRSSIAVVIILAVVARMGTWPRRPQSLKLHLFRSVFHYVAQVCWFIGIVLLPLANVFALEFSMPIWVALLAIIFLGERINRGKAVALALGFIGILIILQPGFGDFNPAAFFVIAAALGFASSIIYTKLIARTDSAMTLLLYMNVIQFPIGLVPALFVWTAPGWADVPWILVIGIANLTAHLSLMKALQLADATVITPIDFLRLPLIAVIGALFYDEPFDLLIMAGAAVIFFGNYYSVMRERAAAARDHARKSPAAGDPGPGS
jgi:drug/metabolite transporter (DMT)-like permease